MADTAIIEQLSGALAPLYPNEDTRRNIARWVGGADAETRRAIAAALSGTTAPPDVESGEDQVPVFVTLSDLQQRPELLLPPECVIPKLAFRGRCVALCGPDKSGKSTLLRHAVARLSHGERFLGGRSQPGLSVWVGLEESIGDAVRELAALHAHGNRVMLVARSTPDLLAQLCDLLETQSETDRADLVVVDSLAEYARITAGEAPGDGDNAGWGAVIRPLVAISRRYDVAVVILHHVRKSDGQYRGPTEIAAAVDALLEMKMPGDKEDPNVRWISGRGRWAIEPFTVALRGGAYELDAGGELSMDARVLLHVERKPGTSLNETHSSVGGRKGDVKAAVNLLIARNDIHNRALGADRYQLYPGPKLPTLLEVSE